MEFYGNISISPYAQMGILAHSAHYSKNWNKDKQDEYNKKYYQEHKDKWGVDSGYSENDKEVKYTGQIGDYGAEDINKITKEHGEFGEDNWLGEGGDVALNTTKDGTKVLLNGDTVVASGKDLDGIDTKVLSKYLTDIYAQAGDHVADKGIKTGTKEHAAFWNEFNAKVNDQLKGLIAKQKQAQHDGLEDFDAEEYLAHHGILGMKHGIKNGPPYPLGSGDHSSSEKKAATQAGISVGSSSGKGSLDAVNSGKKVNFWSKYKAKKAAKKNETDEQKAARKELVKRSGVDFDGDKDPVEQERAYREQEKKNAIARGDTKTIYTKYASEMSTEEINAFNSRVNSMKVLQQNIPKEPTPLDQVEKAVNTIDRINKMAGKAIGAYNTIATVRNSLNPGEKPWVRIDGKAIAQNLENKDKKK